MKVCLWDKYNVNMMRSRTFLFLDSRDVCHPKYTKVKITKYLTRTFKCLLTINRKAMHFLEVSMWKYGKKMCKFAHSTYVQEHMGTVR
jgi:hypothetical protein